MATPATGISGKLSDVCGMGAVVLAGAGVVLLVVVLFVVLFVVLLPTFSQPESISLLR